MDETTIEQLKAKYTGADLHYLEAEDVEIVVKSPSPGDFQSWRAQQQTSDDIWGVNKGFVVLHVVYPSAQEFMALVKQKPGLVEALTRKLVTLAGTRVEFASKKL